MTFCTLAKIIQSCFSFSACMCLISLEYRIEFSSIVFLVVAFLLASWACFFKHFRDTRSVNEESRFPTFFYLVLLLHRFLDTSLDFDPFRRGQTRNAYDATLRLLIALSLFRRKLPIRHVNSDVCMYSDPIFSSSGQWSRNALMQIVAIAPRRTGRKRYTCASTLSHFLFAIPLLVYPISPVLPLPLFETLPPTLCIHPLLSFKIDSPQGVARQA